MMRRFPLLRQGNEMDCLPTCLRMVAVHHGRDCDLEQIRQYTHVGRTGASLAGAADAAERIGMRSLSVRISFEALRAQAPLPCIVHWRGRHFVVVYRITRKRVYVADPGFGRISHSVEEFIDGWTAGGSEGVALFLEPTPDFYGEPARGKTRRRRGFATLFGYIKPYPRWIVQLIFGLLIASMLQLALPFLAQALVDTGVATHNLGFVSLVLIAQLTLLISRAAVDFIRSWLLLHIGARINLAIVSDFLMKLMHLPLSFFDTRRLGDLLERVSDHDRVQNFLTSSSLNALLSGLNLLVFGIVLFAYSGTIFAVFCVGSVAVAGWIILFQRRRRELDYRRFDQLSENRTLLIQLVQGMQEIKLNAAERRKRGEWQTSQSHVFRTLMDGLAVTQYQQGGSIFLNELKNIIVSFVAAREVIAGHMTLGMMLAVTYIAGQLNGPLEQLLNVLNAAQDTSLALERINEVHETPGEDEGSSVYAEPPPLATVRLNRVTFHYEGVKSAAALRDVSFDIPGGAVTAIVGASGSGKTTLLKLLLKIHAPTDGAVQVGGLNLNTLRPSSWRARCGVVMQDGYVFSDTILRNIAMSDGAVDFERALEAVRIANLTDVVDALPLGLETRVGPDGHGLSQGQKQRILIARAVYKQPDYLFFDEATSALDSANERMIIENLQEFFAGRTVVVVAHRLSTVRHADQIIVLDRGSVIERGTHAELAAAKQAYYRLVRNQLELGA
jgi:ATP-binding cassette subfamily B protein